jgi:hypothetical protein
MEGGLKGPGPFATVFPASGTWPFCSGTKPGNTISIQSFNKISGDFGKKNFQFLSWKFQLRRFLYFPSS